MTGDRASTSGRNDAGGIRPRRAYTSCTKRTDGADFLTRALVTRAVRRAGAHQLLRGGACVLAVVVDEAADTATVDKGAQAVLRFSAIHRRPDWKVVRRLPKRQDTSRRTGTDLPFEGCDEASSTIFVVDATFRPSLQLEAMADGVVSLALSCPPNAFHALVANGHLACLANRGPKNNRRRKVVSPEELRRFDAEYVSLSAISSSHGVHPMTMLRKIEKAGVSAVFPVPMSFYQRSEVGLPK